MNKRLLEVEAITTEEKAFARRIFLKILNNRNRISIFITEDGQILKYECMMDIKTDEFVSLHLGL
jgi:hypothetical protein